MKNFKIHFAETDRDAVLTLISRSNDIVLNQVEPRAAHITIQQDDAMADVMYESLLVEIDNYLRPKEIVIVKPQCAEVSIKQI